MGRATADAYGSLLSTQGQARMQAVVQVKTPDAAKDFRRCVDYGAKGSRYHVEAVLMQLLVDQYGESCETIPDGSTIIFVGKWSPCRECTCQMIPGFLEKIGMNKRPLRVKFRFEHYYSAEFWPEEKKLGEDGGNLWTSRDEAQAAYAKLCAAWGEYGSIFLSAPQDLDGGMRGAPMRVKSKLVVESIRDPFTKTSKSVMAYWPI